MNPISNKVAVPVIFKPFVVSIVGVVLGLCWAWLATSNMDYASGATFFGLRTSPWFYLGLPLIVSLSIVATLPFCWAARKGNYLAGLSMFVVVAATIIGVTFFRVLPKARIEALLNTQLPSDCQIVRLRISDSFNDGTNTTGVISGDQVMMQAISAANRLQPFETSLQFLQQTTEDDVLPEVGTIFKNDVLSCYLNLVAGKIYFIVHSTVPDR